MSKPNREFVELACHCAAHRDDSAEFRDVLVHLVSPPLLNLRVVLSVIKITLKNIAFGPYGFKNINIIHFKVQAHFK